MKFLLMIFLCIQMLGCTSSSKCDEALGLWESENTKSGNLSKFIILKESDEFVFKALNTDRVLGSNFKSIMHCIDGKLALNGIPMVGNIDVGVLGSETILMLGQTFKKISKINKSDKYIVINEGEANGFVIKISKTTTGYKGQFTNGENFNSSNVWDFIVEDETIYKRLQDLFGKELTVHYKEVINLQSITTQNEYIIDRIIE